MVENPLTEIVRFQTDRQLHLQPYDAMTEAVNSLEEVLEGLGYDVPKEQRSELATAFKAFVEVLEDTKVITRVPTTIEDRVDAENDKLVFAVGALLKLGYDPSLTIVETAKEINSRLQDPTQKEEWAKTGVKGKFQKWKEQPKDTLYTADYSSCKLCVRSGL